MPHLEPIGTQRGRSEEDAPGFIHSWNALIVGVNATKVGATPYIPTLTYRYK